MSLGLIFVLVLTRLSQTILGTVLAANATRSSEPRPFSTASHLSLRPQWLGSLILASLFTASFELILLAFVPDESASLGIYVPLLAMNCIVLDRFEVSTSPEYAGSAASEIARSLRESGSIGLGFAISLIVISLVRETLGAGTITLVPIGSFAGTVEVGKISLGPAHALAYAGGGFLCLGYLAGAARLLGRLKGRRLEAGGEADGA
jgi:electron transport complex protein RnfE